MSTGVNANEGRPGAALTQGEIARRALKTLAERRMIPTPETFADVYFEMAGQRPGAGTALGVVREMLRDLVRTNRLSTQEGNQMLELAGRHEWPAVRDALEKVLARRHGAAGAGWPQMALALLRHADALHANWTRGRKLDAVTRVVEGAAAEPDVALERLQRLIESWGPALASLPKPGDEPLAVNTLSAQTAHPDGLKPVGERYGIDPAELAHVREQAARVQATAEAWKQVALRAMKVLEHSCGEGSSGQKRLAQYASQHAGPLPADEVDKMVARFTDVVGAIDRQLDEQQRVKSGLQRLLALLCDNMKSLTPEEAWLAGQLEPIRALLAGPIQSAQLAEAEARLSQVLGQQAGARRSLQEAKVALKEMLSTLIERIGSMGSSTGHFYEQVGAYQAELEKATDFDTLSRVIKGLLADTQIVRADIQTSREELLNARRKVEAYEQRVRQLEKELMQVSTLVQKDPLTHALNRRGLEEAFRIETARATRYASPLAMAIIDLDDFKKLNDTLGHLAGDRALVHLLTVMQTALRPTDVVARIGGEEFAMLFSAADIEDATQATERVQHELARRQFTHDGKPYALTFSGGTAQWKPGEVLEGLMGRADEAMYRAKRAGKNRVLRAE